MQDKWPKGRVALKTKLAATLRGSRPGCNPHRSMTTLANLEITSLWRHWWRHNSETIRGREKRRPPRPMKSSELSNGENRITRRQLLQNRKLRHLWRQNLGSRWKLQKNGSRKFQYWCVLQYNQKLECGPMPNLTDALPNIGGALSSTPQSLADAHY